MNGANKADYPNEYQSLIDLDNELGGGNEITQFDIKDLDINPCIGCWNCWLYWKLWRVLQSINCLMPKGWPLR